MTFLIVISISSLYVVAAEPFRDVPGYLRGNVTLRSGADPSWNLSKIEWSIFSNNTWIATYRRGATNIERLSQFKRRLSLNITSGDLTIHNLTSEDSMYYTVVLINTEKNSREHKIRLKVMQHLVEPSIDTIFSTYTNGHCWVLLHCSSQDEDINLSWEVKPFSVTVYKTSNSDGKLRLLLASFSTEEQHPEFTCTSNRTNERAAKAVTPVCYDLRVRCGLWVFFGLIVGLLILLIYIFREQIKALWEHLKNIYAHSS